MAGGAQQIRRYWPGLAAAATVLAILLGTLGAVLWRAGSFSALTPADWAAVRFTLVQAVLSALISVTLAIPVARALARRRFWGRSALVTLLGAPFILPVIVAVMALLAVFGKSGLISDLLALVHLQPVQIYGLHGILLAHVFLNLPLATRLLLQGWVAIPAEQFRLAGSLGFSEKDILRVFERPMLRQVLPGIFVAVFVICTTSFAVALTLGGGPKATTVELAIYQAFRLEYDLGKAAVLAILQFAICAVAALLALWVYVPGAASSGLDRIAQRFGQTSRLAMVSDAFFIGLSALFLVVPLATIILRGLPSLGELSLSVWAAAGRSMAVALATAFLATTLGLALALAVNGLRKWRILSGALESTGYLAIAASPLVLGTGLFLIVFPFAKPADLALGVTVLVNTMMSLPFVLRALIPAVADVERQFGRLGDSLSLTGLARMRWLLVPRLRRPLGFSAGLAAALSVGDLGVIALFSAPDAATLPLKMYQLMGAYRLDQAAGAALLLLILALFLFWVFDRGGRIDADT